MHYAAISVCAYAHEYMQMSAHIYIYVYILHTYRISIYTSDNQLHSEISRQERSQMRENKRQRQIYDQAICNLRTIRSWLAFEIEMAFSLSVVIVCECEGAMWVGMVW